MTKADTAKLLQIIIRAYPTSRMQADDDTLNLWHEMLGELPTEVVATATKAMIATLRYAPSIADITDAVARAVSEARGDLSTADALAKLRRALRIHGYYDPSGARAYLGETIWTVVGMVAGGWSELCMCEDANWPARFERLYKARAEQEQRRLQTPASTREHLAALGAAQMLKQIGGGVDG